MMGNMQQMMKQFQKLQKQMKSIQEELATKEYQGSAGGDLVTATINGSLEIKRIRIQKDIVDPNEVEMLEDLTVAAVNEAIRKAQEDTQSSMAPLAGGLNLPGMGG